MWRVVLIFGVPMMIATMLISPAGFHNLVHSLPLCLALGLILPFVGWRIFLAVFAFPPLESDRLAAVLKLWLGGTVMACAVINLLVAALDYSPARPGPDPKGGFLLAGFVVSMFISCGICSDLTARYCTSRGVRHRYSALSSQSSVLVISSLGTDATQDDRKNSTVLRVSQALSRNP